MRAPAHAAQLALGAFCGLGALFLTACSSPGTTAAPTSTITVTVTASPAATSRPVSGSQIGAPAGRRHDAARTLVTLAPGATAHATLAVSDVLIGDNCRHRRVPVNWIQVYPPGRFSALYAPLNLLACADPGLVTMTVTLVSGG